MENANMFDKDMNLQSEWLKTLQRNAADLAALEKNSKSQKVSDALTPLLVDFTKRAQRAPTSP